MRAVASIAVAVASAVVAIAVSFYFLSALLNPSEVLWCMLIHSVAGMFCALAGAFAIGGIGSGGEARSRASLFLFLVAPALLLPIGGVLTVLGAIYVLRSEPEPQEVELKDSVFALEPRDLRRPSPPVLEPLVGVLRTADEKNCRLVASGLEGAGTIESRRVADVLARLQQDPDTETRFRAQGAVARRVRKLEQSLSARETKSLACLELSQWSSATGADETALVCSAIGQLEGDDASEWDPAMIRLAARAYLDRGDTKKAAGAVEQLRSVGVTEEGVASLRAEVMFQQGDWKELVEYCRNVRTSDPALLENARFWNSVSV